MVPGIAEGCRRYRNAVLYWDKQVRGQEAARRQALQREDALVVSSMFLGGVPHIGCYVGAVVVGTRAAKPLSLRSAVPPTNTLRTGPALSFQP